VNPVFFTDRDLGKQFPAILRATGLRVEIHADHFAPNCPDEDWLMPIGQRGWIAVTHDGRIGYKPNELRAVFRYHVALLVVVGKAPFPQLAHSFVATKGKILDFVSERKPPYIAKIYRNSATNVSDDPIKPGRIEMWRQ
jgi:hypothetical protein